ncbi:MAG: hypothetical protein Q4G33_09850 [bacterium]|nr:hypothetical protein [bacterium]
MKFDKFGKYFDVLSCTEVRLVSKGDYDDYENTYSLTEIGTLTGDMQPYSGGLAKEDYGLRVECEKRFFTRSALPELKDNDLYVVDGNRSFRIMYIGDYDMGAMLLLKEAELNGRRK